MFVASHIPIGIVSSSEDVRRQFSNLSIGIFAHIIALIDWKKFVRINRDQNRTGVGLETDRWKTLIIDIEQGLHRFDPVCISYEDCEEWPILSDLPIRSYHQHLRSMRHASDEISFDWEIEVPRGTRTFDGSIVETNERTLPSSSIRRICPACVPTTRAPISTLNSWFVRWSTQTWSP